MALCIIGEISPPWNNIWRWQPRKVNLMNYCFCDHHGMPAPKEKICFFCITPYRCDVSNDFLWFLWGSRTLGKVKDEFVGDFPVKIRTAMILVIEIHQNPAELKPVTLHKSRIRPDIPPKGKEKENQRIKSVVGDMLVPRRVHSLKQIASLHLKTDGWKIRRWNFSLSEFGVRRQFSETNLLVLERVSRCYKSLPASGIAKVCALGA